MCIVSLQEKSVTQPEYVKKSQESFSIMAGWGLQGGKSKQEKLEIFGSVGKSLTM